MFNITGEYFTENARDLALSGKWMPAINFLRESFEGFTFEDALKIVSGDYLLTGNSRENNISLEKDSNSSDYKEEIKEVYIHDLFYESGVLYKFERLIGMREISDMMVRYRYVFDATYPPEAQLESVIKYMSNLKTEKVFRINSAQYLVAKVTDINLYPLWFLKTDYFPNYNAYYEYHYGIKKIQTKTMPVPTIKKEKYSNDFYHRCNQQYIEDSAKRLGYVSTKIMSDHLRQQVLDKCAERNVTWEDISFLDENKNPVNMKVPKEIIMGYLSRDPKDWEPICESNLKMDDDSGWHSDLWLAMGHDLSSDSYNQDLEKTKLFYDAIYYYRGKHIKNIGEFSILNDAKMKKFTDRIVDKDSTDIKDTDILVLPDAGMKYDRLARKAGMIICERGGQMSHLVMLGEKEMIPVIQMQDAISKLKSQTDITVDFIHKKLIGKYK